MGRVGIYRGTRLVTGSTGRYIGNEIEVGGITGDPGGTTVRGRGLPAIGIAARAVISHGVVIGSIAAGGINDQGIFVTCSDRIRSAEGEVIVILGSNITPGGSSQSQRQ